MEFTQPGLVQPVAQLRLRPDLNGSFAASELNWDVDVRR
jgi:hypothetical protein